MTIDVLMVTRLLEKIEKVLSRYVFEQEKNGSREFGVASKCWNESGVTDESYPIKCM